MPNRYSRHYYDLYVIGKSDFKKSVFEQKALLRNAADFKMKFYPRKWAEYEKAEIGPLKLLPPEYCFEALKNDYKNMENMFFSQYPSL